MAKKIKSMSSESQPVTKTSHCSKENKEESFKSAYEALEYLKDQAPDAAPMINIAYDSAKNECFVHMCYKGEVSLRDMGVVLGATFKHIVANFSTQLTDMSLDQINQLLFVALAKELGIVKEKEENENPMQNS